MRLHFFNSAGHSELENGLFYRVPPDKENTEIAIPHFRKTRRELGPKYVFRNCFWDHPVSYWPIFFPDSKKGPRSLGEN